MRDSTALACAISFVVAVGCGGSTSGDSNGSGGGGSGGKSSGGSSSGATGGATTGGSGGTGNVSGGGSGGVGGTCVGTPCGPDGTQCCEPGSSCGSSGSSVICSCTSSLIWTCSSGTGGAGGCANVGCGPHGTPCCEPGSGCATASGGGPSTSCNCTDALIWDCSTGAGGAGGSGGAPCNGPNGCAGGTTCCGGKCVNLQNDPFNCGSCGSACAASPPYCSGVCQAPPCFAPTLPPPGSFCCGQNHCKQGQLCCDVQGPGPTGGPVCHTPSAAQPTCPIGCPLCQ
jgi:hypothetical protein